nr:DnaJ protein homolog [Ipomoea batatas]
MKDRWKVLEVHVENGMQNWVKKITFLEEADEAPDTVTGDISVYLATEEHLTFQAKGDDLFFEHTLTLAEALDANNDEGIRCTRKPFMSRELYIHFTVDFPESLSPEPIESSRGCAAAQGTSKQITDMELMKVNAVVHKCSSANAFARGSKIGSVEVDGDL